jgi:hypothetical protein
MKSHAHDTAFVLNAQGLCCMLHKHFVVVNMKCCLDSMFCMTGLLLRICIFHAAGVISSAVVLHEYAVFQ